MALSDQHIATTPGIRYSEMGILAAKVFMKHHAQANKKLPKALFFSLLLHVVLMTLWGAFWKESQHMEEDLSIQVEIFSSQRNSPKTIKRRMSFSKTSSAPDAQAQQIVESNQVVRPPRPQISATPQSNLPVEQQFSILTEETIPLSTTSDTASEASLLPLNPQVARGGLGMGRGLSIGKQITEVPRSLGMEFQTVTPEISGMTQPDVALVKVARHLLSTRESNVIDIVFIVDASQSMRNDIDAVRDHLTQMTDMLESELLDFSVGIVAFRDGTSFSLLGWDFQITPQTNSIKRIQKALNDIHCRGGEKALDALIRSANEVQFRRNAERRFILVTDEYVSGVYTVREVVTKMKSAKISVDVIGRDEHAQKLIAQATDGLWLPISSLKE